MKYGSSVISWNGITNFELSIFSLPPLGPSGCFPLNLRAGGSTVGACATGTGGAGATGTGGTVCFPLSLLLTGTGTGTGTGAGT